MLTLLRPSRILTTRSGSGEREREREREGESEGARGRLAHSPTPPLPARSRFTSPHPKDFPPHLLQLVGDRPNVCSSLHLPAQSGSDSVLERMRRGYRYDSYMRLVSDARSAVPGVSLSSDFIAGFCGETEEEHSDTIRLMREVEYDQAFMFAYSMRGKTHAHRRMEDDVPDDVKQRR